MRAQRDFFKVHNGPTKTNFTRAEAESFGAHGHKCHYCKSDGPLSTDHITPRAKGGTDDVENLIPACRACNQAKGKRDYDEFVDDLHMQVVSFACSLMGDY